VVRSATVTHAVRTCIAVPTANLTSARGRLKIARPAHVVAAVATHAHTIASIAAHVQVVRRHERLWTACMAPHANALAASKGPKGSVRLATPARHGFVGLLLAINGAVTYRSCSIKAMPVVVVAALVWLRKVKTANRAETTSACLSSRPKEQMTGQISENASRNVA
jgi:hypothetical protein